MRHSLRPRAALGQVPGPCLCAWCGGVMSPTAVPRAQNTGGKTAALKALGLAALMARAGLSLPVTAGAGALRAAQATVGQGPLARMPGSSVLVAPRPTAKVGWRGIGVRMSVTSRKQ